MGKDPYMNYHMLLQYLPFLEQVVKLVFVPAH